MPNTYSQIYIQAVFAVKGRKSLINKSWQDEMHKYICGIVNNKKQKVYAIGGVADHIHILISIDPAISFSDLIRDIKTNSSKWINDRHFTREKFEWQNVFGAFSYGQSQLDTIIAYINNQERRHKKITFKEEYFDLLDKFQIDYDERYLFEFIENV